MCGHGVIAVTTIAIERNLIVVPRERAGSVRLTLDSPAGPIHATATIGADDKVSRVRFRNVPSFVLHPAVPVVVQTARSAWTFELVAPSTPSWTARRSALPILPERLPELRSAGMEIKYAIEKAVKVEHPLEPQLKGIYGTIFTGAPTVEGADLRNIILPTRKSIVRHAAPERRRSWPFSPRWECWQVPTRCSPMKAS